ncbi:MAG: hypothetical protein M8862_10295, partial [marine benthic group bacterium]|nr:hypothetical protein [Gemmatimonadota bacterium]
MRLPSRPDRIPGDRVRSGAGGRRHAAPRDSRVPAAPGHSRPPDRPDRGTRDRDPLLDRSRTGSAVVGARHLRCRVRRAGRSRGQGRPDRWGERHPHGPARTRVSKGSERGRQAGAGRPRRGRGRRKHGDGLCTLRPATRLGGHGSLPSHTPRDAGDPAGGEGGEAGRRRLPVSRHADGRPCEGRKPGGHRVPADGARSTGRERPTTAGPAGGGPVLDDRRLRADGDRRRLRPRVSARRRRDLGRRRGGRRVVREHYGPGVRGRRRRRPPSL